jgi:demethylmenaquinone methyltransferase/2-methoxy-6-polyprenyl-1,4-benzoquinol methylase
MPEATAVRRMFESVAPRYDLLNHVLSMGIDRSWRRRVVEALELRPEQTVLDLCCGTGDLALALAPQARTSACDFTLPMLAKAKLKAAAAKTKIDLAAADALSLPFASGSFDAATVAFGVRNLEDMGAGLREIRRTLKPGGVLAILEFSQPHRWWMRVPYRFYLNVILPRVGSYLSRRKDAYRYLADSIMGFPDPETLVGILTEAGYSAVTYERLSGGIVALHLARKPVDE